MSVAPTAAAAERVTLDVVRRLGAAVDRHDVRAVVALLAPDCRFESTTPPDGETVLGAQAVGEVFAALFRSARERRFDTEEIVPAGERATVLWTHRWTDPDGRTGHVRGVDVFRVRNGLVAEKLSYVKG